MIALEISEKSFFGALITFIKYLFVNKVYLWVPPPVDDDTEDTP
ncbi:hypothetical protein SIB_14 [Klebsiella phage vB_KpnP_Sibilus]|uniref:Uncharacterized protein n=1 Tax=Klebsiella phage vB_KpnP_Sibilus TaxID=2591368 RepID=A0A5B9NJB1_9CAUD|nr:hypothetical protein SIB_14 [Klebsiella phage vB_KpnP_Sibilus]